MTQHRHWMQRMAEASNLYGESLPGVPIVEMAGDRRVVIERHSGVIEYGTEQIRIRVKYGVIRICGCNLELKQMSKQLLIISGRIDCIQIQRGCKQ